MVIEPAEGSSRREVFVVDDAEEVRDFIVWLLRSGGYRALAAEDEQVVKSLLLTEHPVLVVAEEEIPACKELDVLVFCHSQFPEVPVVVVLKDAAARRPVIKDWIPEPPANPSSSDQFRASAQDLIARTLGQRRACSPCG